MTRARDTANYEDKFASGTKMIFNQTASPTGWTKVTGSGNDTALRVTTGTVGTGGTVAFETAFASVTPTITMTNDAVTISAQQVADHTHNIKGTDTSSSGADSDIIRYIIQTNAHNNNNQTSNAQNGGTNGQSHTHTNTAASSAVNLDVSYVDVIIATKD